MRILSNGMSISKKKRELFYLLVVTRIQFAKYLVLFRYTKINPQIMRYNNFELGKAFQHIKDSRGKIDIVDIYSHNSQKLFEIQAKGEWKFINGYCFINRCNIPFVNVRLLTPSDILVSSKGVYSYVLHLKRNNKIFIKEFISSIMEKHYIIIFLSHYTNTILPNYKNLDIYDKTIKNLLIIQIRRSIYDNIISMSNYLPIKGKMGENAIMVSIILHEIIKFGYVILNSESNILIKPQYFLSNRFKSKHICLNPWTERSGINSYFESEWKTIQSSFLRKALKMYSGKPDCWDINTNTGKIYFNSELYPKSCLNHLFLSLVDPRIKPDTMWNSETISIPIADDLLNKICSIIDNIGEKYGWMMKGQLSKTRTFRLESYNGNYIVCKVSKSHDFINIVDNKISYFLNIKNCLRKPKLFSVFLSRILTWKEILSVNDKCILNDFGVRLICWGIECVFFLSNNLEVNKEIFCSFSCLPEIGFQSKLVPNALSSKSRIFHYHFSIVDHVFSFSVIYSAFNNDDWISVPHYQTRTFHLVYQKKYPFTVHFIGGINISILIKRKSASEIFIPALNHPIYINNRSIVLSKFNSREALDLRKRIEEIYLDILMISPFILTSLKFCENSWPLMNSCHIKIFNSQMLKAEITKTGIQIISNQDDIIADSINELQKNISDNTRSQKRSIIFTILKILERKGYNHHQFLSTIITIISFISDFQVDFENSGSVSIVTKGKKITIKASMSQIEVSSSGKMYNHESSLVDWFLGL